MEARIRPPLAAHRPWPLLALVALCLALALPARARAVDADALQQGRRVLLLYSYGPGFPTSAGILKGVRSVLNSPGLTLDQEFMDARHLNDPESLARYRAWLGHKLARRPRYDAVIAADDAAFDLAVDQGALFGHAPVVFLGVNNVKRAVAQSGNPRVTGVVEHVSIPETINLARQLQPGLRRLLVISDDSPGGRADLATLESQRELLAGVRVDVRSLTRLTWSELAAVLDGLGPGDAILPLAAYKDAAGQGLSFHESLALLRGHAAVPIYHLWEHGVGEGLVGGYVMSHREHGRVAAERVLRILAGESAGSIPVLATSPNRPVFDLRELERHGLDRAALPRETLLLNDPPPIYVRSPRETALAASAILLLLAVIGLSLRSNRERRGHLAQLRREQSMMRSLLDATPDLIYFKAPDGRYITCNKACAEALGQAPEAVAGRRAADFLPAHLANGEREEDNWVLDTGTPRRSESWIPHASGRRLLLDTMRAPVYDQQGRVWGLVGVARDVTGEHETRRRLRLASEVFDQAAEGIVITDSQAVIEAVNPAFSHITGYSPEEAVGHRITLLSSGRHTREFYARMWETIRRDGRWQGEIWNRRKSGDAYPEWLTISALNDDDGAAPHYVGIFFDMSDIKASEERLKHSAQHDALTGLPNRALLNDRMELALRRASRDHRMVGTVFVDLDHFKDINDSFGHAVGDEVLREVAARLSSCLREGDTVARLGGDEFVVLLEGLDEAQDADRAAERIFASLAAPIHAGGQELYVGASLGISIYPRDGDDAAALIRNADTAMYQAKSQGRNTVQCYAENQTEAARHRMTLENALRRALAHGEIQVVYQPQYELIGGTLVGMEALARWTDEELGAVAPDEFIPLAESNGLIVPLGEMVLDKVCAQVHAWNAQGLHPPRVAVNVSGRQLRRPDFLARVEGRLRAHGCSAGRLELAVTESDILRDAEPAIATLHQVRDLGMGLALDDFGTGYSSLSYLKRLPVQRLKIDRGFIAGLPGDANDRAIVQAILAMGASLGLEVIAEGVENAAQAAYLASAGCRAGQGYHLGRPQPADACAELLGANRALERQKGRRARARVAAERIIGRARGTSPGRG